MIKKLLKKDFNVHNKAKLFYSGTKIQKEYNKEEKELYF